jgi:alkaline phosphatase D
MVDDASCPQRRDPARTLLGAEQLTWLRREMLAPRARWTFIAQQTAFSRMMRNDRNPRYWTDGWDGYPAERARVLGLVSEARPPNPVFLGGDVHTTYVCDVKADFDAPRSPTIATEFCGTSITSPTSLDAKRIAALIEANPHVLFGDAAHRGYLLAELGEKTLSVELRGVEDITQREPKVATIATWIVNDGRPGALRA